MAADAEKTIEYAFPTNNGNLITNTTLATSTRYNFPAIGITIPETTSRNFKSVILECHWRDAYTTVYNVVGWRLGISTGSNPFSDVDYTPTAVANTGDHEAGIVVIDVTDYFNSNFGTSASTSCQGAIAIATATAAAVQNLTAKLYITYEYDSSGSRTIKTVRIPIQSASALLTGAAIEIGTTGTTAAPAKQIPALDTFLPETNKEYKTTWFEMYGNDGGAATTDFNGVYQINAGTTASRCLLEQALSTGTYFYDIWLTKYTNNLGVVTDDYAISASAASAFNAYSSLASRFDAFGGLFCVTYEYDTTSASVMNSVMLPIDSAPGFIASTSASNANYIARDFWVVEPNVNLEQSGIVLYMQSAGGATLNLGTNSQTVRPYTLTALVNSGGHSVVHRIDHNSGLSLSRGKNTLNLKAYTSAAAAANTLVGFLYLNYTSASAPGGEKCHNHTTIWHHAAQATTGAVATHNIVPNSTLQRTPNIISPYYFLNGLGFLVCSRFGTAIDGITLVAEKLTGEFNSDGWAFLDTFVHSNDGELASYKQIAACLDLFNQTSFQTGKMNIESQREYRLYYSTAALYWLRSYLTYHCNTFSVSGSFINPAGSGSDVQIDVIRYTDDYFSGSVLSSSSGSWTALVFDNVYPYYVSASQDETHIGRSASALAI